MLQDCSANDEWWYVYRVFEIIEHNMSKESTRQFIYVEIGITTVYCLVIPTNDKIL